MKHTLLLFLFLSSFISCNLYCTQNYQPEIEIEGPIYFVLEQDHFYNNNSSTNVQQTTVHTNMEHTTSVQQPPQITPTPPAKTNWFAQPLKWIKNSKVSTVITGVTLSAIAGTLYIFNKFRVLRKNNTWSSWQSDIPLAALLELDTQTVLAELYNDIHAKYGSNHATVPSLIGRFTNDIEKERSDLEQLLRLHKKLTAIKITTVFPNLNKLAKQAQQKIDRLQFLQKLSTLWFAEIVPPTG